MRMPNAKFSTYFLLASLIPTFVTLSIGIGIGAVWSRNYRIDNQKRKLALAGSYIATMIDESELGLRDPALARRIQVFAPINDQCITIVLPDGTVVAQSAEETLDSNQNLASREEIREALAGRIGARIRKSERLEGEYLFVAQPWRNKEQIAAVIRVGKKMDSVRAEQLDFAKGIAGFIGAYLLATVLIAFTVSTIFGKFVRRMSGIAERMAGGNFDLRVRPVHIDELNVLSESLNSMAVRVGKTMQELVAEKYALEKARDELRSAVDLKEAYLKELQHRVKNNLNVISSMMHLELGRLDDQGAKRIFQEMITRVETVSKIYESLYKSADLETVDLEPYLKGLADSIQRAYADERGRVSIETAVEPIRVDSKKAVPIGLILNECLTNAFKYAYPPPRSGTVRVRLEQRNAEIVMTVSDEGIGFDPEFRPELSTSLGLQLVRVLSEQIGGRLSINGSGGVTVTLRLPPR